MIDNKRDYNQIHKMTDHIPKTFPLISSEEEALNDLYLIDGSIANSSTVYDIIDYELLIYLELDEEIQQLIVNIKENVYHSFILKHKYVLRLTDDLCKNNFPVFVESSTNYYYEELGIKGEKNDEI